MKIIRVSGCHDCIPYAKECKSDEIIYYYCDHPSWLPFYIGEHMNTKTLPNYCPLEDVAGVIENWKDVYDII